MLKTHFSRKKKLYKNMCAYTTLNFQTRYPKHTLFFWGGGVLDRMWHIGKVAEQGLIYFLALQVPASLFFLHDKSESYCFLELGLLVLYYFRFGNTLG